MRIACKPVRDHAWIHATVGLVGNLLFVIGSVLFLPPLEAYRVCGVWLFIIGSALMLVGGAGDLMFKLRERRERD